MLKAITFCEMAYYQYFYKKTQMQLLTSSMHYNHPSLAAISYSSPLQNSDKCFNVKRTRKKSTGTTQALRGLGRLCNSIYTYY